MKKSMYETLMECAHEARRNDQEHKRHVEALERAVKKMQDLLTGKDEVIADQDRDIAELRWELRCARACNAELPDTPDNREWHKLLTEIVQFAENKGQLSRAEWKMAQEHVEFMLPAPAFPWPMQRPADPEGMTRAFADKRANNKKFGNVENNCLPWSDAESDAVKYYYEMGQSPADIAEVFGRTEGAINAHLSSLGVFNR